MVRSAPESATSRNASRCGTCVARVSWPITANRAATRACLDDTTIFGRLTASSDASTTTCSNTKRRPPNTKRSACCSIRACCSRGASSHAVAGRCRARRTRAGPVRIRAGADGFALIELARPASGDLRSAGLNAMRRSRAFESAVRRWAAIRGASSFGATVSTAQIFLRCAGGRMQRKTRDEEPKVGTNFHDCADVCNQRSLFVTGPEFFSLPRMQRPDRPRG